MASKESVHFVALIFFFVHVHLLPSDVDCFVLTLVLISPHDAGLDKTAHPPALPTSHV